MVKDQGEEEPKDGRMKFVMSSLCSGRGRCKTMECNCGGICPKMSGWWTASLAATSLMLLK